MVYWITGKKNSGKTTYAYRLKKKLKSMGKSVVILDGGELRGQFPVGYNEEKRYQRTRTICKLAIIFERQDVIPIIALLSEKAEWRKNCREMFRRSKLIYLPGGISPKGVIYEVPGAEELE